jgi:3-hydroxyisobutyrate dehydrogenase-like beta-hydroxyacid dehydrogenase
VKVGFIGLGAMGLPMARRVVAAGFETCTVTRVRRGPIDELVGLGATALASAAAVARAADVVVTILPADRELDEVVRGAGGLLEGWAPGKVLIDMTTATALTMEAVERAVTSAGGLVLDAPVSGGTPAAAQGTLTIMVGGEAALLERHRPLLETMGKHIVLVGPVGQGKVVKMVNQAMAAAHLLVLGEAFALGVRCGARPDTLYEVITSSSGYSRMMDLRLPGFLLDGHAQPGFRLDLMKKDVNLALQSGQALGVPLPITALVGQLFAAASTAGHGDEDFSAAARFVAALAAARLDQPKPTAPADRS